MEKKYTIPRSSSDHQCFKTNLLHQVEMMMEHVHLTHIALVYPYTKAICMYEVQ
jgi:hypothetical protein